MNALTLLLWAAAALLGVVVYLLVVASSRASHTEARVQALLREARAGGEPPVTH
jgi:type II secretory pathway component PulM